MARKNDQIILAETLREFEANGTIFTADEVEKILDQITFFGFKGMRDRAMLETFFATYIRIVELRYLDLEYIDFEQQLVRVRKGKGKREYIIPITYRAGSRVTFQVERGV